KQINIMITIMLILVTWVFFRADSVGYALQYLITMFDITNMSTFNSAHIEISTFFLVISLTAIAWVLFPQNSITNNERSKQYQIINSDRLKMVLIPCILILSVVKVVIFEYSPFIYFRF